MTNDDGRTSVTDPVHVYPMNDLAAHILTGLECPCQPDAQTSETGATIVIHHSFDGRETIEAITGKFCRVIQ